ncbi:MAG: hypothetical protein AAFY10_13120, partial [Pseudomonadota bacterium]
MYDARSSTGDNANIVFGVVTLVVVGLAFALAWFGSGLLGGNGSGGSGKLAAANPVEIASDSPLLQAFPSADEQRLLSALASLDKNRYAELEADIAKARGRDKQIELLGEATGRALLDNADHLAHVSAADLNGMLDAATSALTKVKANSRELCLGSTYSDFEHLSPRQAQREAERLMQRAGFDKESAHAMGVAMQADLLEMTLRARANPQRHGKLTSQDEAAFESLLMSFMTDPAFMRIAMADNQQQAMANLNVCDMGLKVLREVRRLPDGTKARAWASVFDMPEFRRGLRQAKNFSF